ncbi:MAG: hypothetical protein HQ519_17260 [Planctomycetes bacterium]|nr:hypothetical protein [Planctomycetota bacterium]
MPESSGRRHLFVISLLWALLSYAALGMSDETLAPLLREDGVFETASAIFFLAAAAVALGAFWKQKLPTNKLVFGRQRNVFLFLLGAFFLLCFLEEISWGQRMFGWNTPDSLKVWNKQKEANLHNLWIFARENSDGTLKQGLASIMTASKMFSLFWMGYCVALPLAHRFSDKLRLLMNRFQVPIVPLGIGILFVLNYIAAKISQLVIQAQHVHQITEIKEANFAMLFLIAICIMVGERQPQR